MSLSAVTLTTTNAGSNSWAVIWEANAARPGSSTLNYTTASPIANTTIVPVCINCGSQNDIQVYVRSTAQVVGDVVGYFSRLSCPSGHTQINGKCIETSLGTTTANFFSATLACKTAGGRLPTPGELCEALRILSGDSTGEHSDSVYYDGTFKNMRIGDGIKNCSLVNAASTNTTDPFRCVKPFSNN